MERRPQERLGAVEFALKYPFTNEHSKYGSIAWGLLMSLLSILIVPVFVLVGYFFEIREAAAKGEEQAPKFEDFTYLFKEGLIGSVAYLVFFIIIGILAAVLSAISDWLVLLPLLAYIYVVPAVGILYSVERSIGRTLQRLPTFVQQPEYAVETLRFAALLVGMYIILAVGSVLTFGLGAIVLTPFLLYVRPSFWGHFYYRMNEDEMDEDEQTQSAQQNTPESGIEYGSFE